MEQSADTAYIHRHLLLPLAPSTTRDRSFSLRLEPEGTETVPEEGCGHAAAHAFVLLEDGLQVHGLPDRAGFDVLGFQGQADGFPIRAELGGVYRDDCQPAVVAAPGGFGA